MERAITYLEEERPLITIPMNKINDFIKIANKYNWQITDIKENLYRTTTLEVIVNGNLSELESTKNKTISLSKVYCFYQYKLLKECLKNYLAIFCKNH